MTDDRQTREEQAERLYNRYAKPLEQSHKDEYIAVALDGRTVLDLNLKDLFQKARTTLGPGSFVFKIGQRAIWKWR